MKRVYKYLLIFSFTTIVTGLTYISGSLLHYYISDMSILRRSDEGSTHQFYDIFASFANNSLSKRLSQNIVVLNTDDCSRTDIIDAVEQIQMYSPRIIGIDIDFKESGTDPERLQNVLNRKNILLVKGFDPNLDAFYNLSFFDEMMDNASYAVANLDIKQPWGVIRTYPTSFSSDVDTIDSYCMALAKSQLQDKNVVSSSQSRLINFNHVEIPVINAKMITDSLGNADPDLLYNKIVLFGDIRNTRDTYLTPVGPLAGVMIHAFSAETIIDQSFIHISKIASNFIAICISFIFVLLLYFVKTKCGNFAEIITRCFQILLMSAFVILGFLLYYNSQVYIDFSITVIMLGLSAFFFDLLYWVIAKFISK